MSDPPPPLRRPASRPGLTIGPTGNTTGDPANQPFSIPVPAPAGLSKDSSKSTPSVDRSTESSSLPPRITTPRTPYTPVAQSPAHANFRIHQSPRGSVGSMVEEGSAKSAKVAIPRLKRAAESGDGNTKSGGRHRVNHACEPCRHRKTKCSGERPTCRHCQDFKIYCYYADGKRDRVKKQYSTMQDKVTDYEKILRGLVNRVSDADAELIRITLERASLVDPDEAVIETTSTTMPSVEMDGDLEASGAESEVSGGRGSTGALDRTDEDFTREGAKTTGFMGKNSDVTWLQRLRQENQYGEGTPHNDPNAARLAESSGPSFKSSGARATTNVPLPETDQAFTIQESSYHLNDIAISTYEAVDAYEMPTHDHAQQLFSTYMARVNPSFPIIGRVNLQNQFFKFLARPVTRPPAKWLAILNMVFAISAKYSHLVQADWQADERDHLIYFTRARLLVIDTDTLFTHSDLQMIQVLGLMGYYLTATNQVNRAWNIVGLAVRQANALGLNMRNESSQLTDALKEIRYRVWWALYTLEHQLCSITGRPNCIVEQHCTTPLPVPINEEEFETEVGNKLLNTEHQRGNRAPSSNTHTPPIESKPPSRSNSNKAENSRSPSATATAAQGELEWTKDVQPNSALFFLFSVQLSRVTEAVFQKLYNPSAVEGKWSDMQAHIGTLNQQLENWYRTLPPAFDFKRKQRDRDFYEARLALGFHYYATKQMLHRPCLCRLDRKIPGQSQKSQEFNHAAATACVISAQDQLALIPDEPNAVGLLRVGPWANILHMLVQSGTVLTLEISFRAHHMPQQVDEITESAKKAVRWLHALGDENLAAARAWRICNDLLHGAVKKIGRQLDDLPEKPPRAAGAYSDDTSMSGMTAIQGQSFETGQGQQADFTPATYSHMGISDLNTYVPAQSLDHFGRYDQIFSLPANMGSSSIQFGQSSGPMPYDGMPSEAEMSFMNQYTEQQDDPSSRPGQHGRSRFN